MDELHAWLVLARAPGLHAGILQPLLALLHSPTAILTSSPSALRAAGAPAALFDWLQARAGGGDQQRLAEDLRWLAAQEHHFVPWGSADYPALLEHLPDAPVGLFVRGDPEVLALPQLAMVGSRSPTPTGRDTAGHFAAHLARCGLTITSGLAVGIDAASHRGALDGGGRTIAVCGTGLDIDYPGPNTALAAAIAAQGALISEFPLGTPPVRHNFPRRNRLISGLSLGTLVVEAATRSGSLITARLAGEQGRAVFAIPGSIHNPLARGCHQLIRQGATLVETAQDILNELSPLPPETGMNAATAGARTAGPTEADAGSVLDKDYKILLDALGFEPAGVDILVARTGLKAEEVASMLLILELEARIEPCPGGLYVRRAPK
ncbi:hypothetical protein ACG33_00540 [Steroidobacter denitrificans]|uniref:Uncharacterized protein n=1 Tax=Steroidobacter denitrificans TaxID=465721 RepID=A0A127F594_STEDE|nr:DNA-processing protein DprA [Steroidobacter denitrificans]AMN45614.1 hypothetical protein ACG33_00540 [Steroidobacter denitrificans]